MYRILELRSISAIDEHNWATNKTECPTSTDNYILITNLMHQLLFIHKVLT